MPFVRDRIEEADRSFFERVSEGYEAIARAEPERVRKLNASGSIEEIQATIWNFTEAFIQR